MKRVATEERRVAGALLVLVLGVWPVGSEEADRPLVIPKGQSQSIPVEGFTRYIAFPDNKVISVETGKDRVVVTGTEVGEAFLHIWDKRQARVTYRIQVVERLLTPAELLEQVKADLAKDELLAEEPIQLRTEGETLALSGEVSSLEVVARAGKVAQRYFAKVDNQLSVPPKISLETKIHEEIARQLGVMLRVTSQNGDIVLEGEVDREEKKQQAEDLARKLGAEKVQNRLTVTQPPAEVRDQPARVEVQVEPFPDEWMPVVGPEIKAREVIEVEVNGSQLVEVPGELVRMSVAAEEIVDPVPLAPTNPNQVLLNGLSEGETTLMLWYRPDPLLKETKVVSYTVRVGQPKPKVEAPPEPGLTPADLQQALDDLVQRLQPKEPGQPPRRAVTAEDIEEALEWAGFQDLAVRIVERMEGEGQPQTTIIVRGEVNSEAERAGVEEVLSAYAPKEQLRLLVKVREVEIPTPAVMPDLPPVVEPEVPPPPTLEERARQLEETMASLGLDGVRVELIERADTQDVVALLSGSVPTAGDILKAMKVAQAQYGKNVENFLEPQWVPEPPPWPKEEPTPTPAPAAGEEQEAPPLPPVEDVLLDVLERYGVADRVRFRVTEEEVIFTGQVADRVLELLERDLETALEPYEGLALNTERLITIPLQIAVDVKILELTGNELQKLGSEFGAASLGGGGVGGAGGVGGVGGAGRLQTGATGVGVGGTVVGGQMIIGERTPGGSWARVDALASRINALVSENKGRILSNPTVRFDDGGESTFNVGGEFPIVSTTVAGGGGGGMLQSVTFEPYGLNLQLGGSVTALDVDTGQDIIELTVQAEISDLDYGNAITLAGIGTIPARTTRRIETSLTMNQNATVVLGGLVSERESVNRNKVPLLGDMPLVGALFRYKETKKARTTLAIVLTPYTLR